MDAPALVGGALLALALLATVPGLLARPPPRLPSAGAAARVSVIVPARDEARNLGRLLESLSAGPAAEILVVEGGSADGTRAIAEAWAARDARVRVVDEPPLPPGWVGKCWACWHGRRAAGGDWLLFTDADTAHAPSTLPRALAHAHAEGAELLTGLTRQELETFGERVAMPPIFALIQTAAGGAGQEALGDPERAIANGQFILVRASAYDRIGGHEAVKGSVVEDLALGRVAARAGVLARFVSLDDVVRCRMYRGWREMFAGWRKGVAAGASRTPPREYVLVLAAASAGLLALPAAIAALALGSPLGALLAGGAWLAMSARVRRAQAFQSGAGWRHALLHPLGFATFVAIVAASHWDRWRGHGALWKGRRYQA